MVGIPSHSFAIQNFPLWGSIDQPIKYLTSALYSSIWSRVGTRFSLSRKKIPLCLVLSLKIGSIGYLLVIHLISSLSFQEYIQCAETWMGFVMKHFGVSLMILFCDSTWYGFLYGSMSMIVTNKLTLLSVIDQLTYINFIYMCPNEKIQNAVSLKAVKLWNVIKQIRDCDCPCNQSFLLCRNIQWC